MERRDPQSLLLVLGLLVLCLGAAGAFFGIAPFLGFHADRTPAVPVAGTASAAIAMALAALVSPVIALGSVVLLIRGRRRCARAEERLARMSHTADQAGGLVAIVNRKGRIEYVNPAVERVTGYSRQELIGRRSVPWLPWYENERLFDDVRAIVQDGGSFSGTITCRRKDGAPFVLQEQVTALRDEAGRVARFVSTASDVTREKRLEDRLKFLRANDAVTGLPNRRSFNAELGERLQGGRRVDVIVLDIDRFKLVNDVFGMALGDEVLRRIGRAIRSALDPRDFVARLGSDEFGVIHEEAGRLRDVEAVVERIRKAVSGTFDVGGKEVAATVSMGIASRPEHGDDAAALLRHAGMALAQSRSQGRNGVLVFSPDLSQRISGAYSMERNLAGALKNGEYEVDYQPYCDLTTRRLTGAEALIRWKSPELGSVSPALFIPALEETGAIVEVGEWVLRTACRQVGEWKKRNRAVAVAVNLSHVQFRNRDLVPLVSDALRESGIDPGLLTLELTESVCISDMDLTVGVLKRLKDVGVSLSVDDFGTGYSSLSYIQKLPVDALKIDQSFVREVARDPDAASIVSAITAMARSLQLKTIGEGVESEEQRNVLRLLRCDYGQGYLFSPAVPPADLERFGVAPTVEVG